MLHELRAVSALSHIGTSEPSRIEGEAMATGAQTMCVLCTGLRPVGATAEDGHGIGACDAFPKGISAEIQFRGFNHRQAHHGDNGVRFKPKRNVSRSAVDQMLARAREFLEYLGG
jgi:hypothetical protein